MRGSINSQRRKLRPLGSQLPSSSGDLFARIFLSAPRRHGCGTRGSFKLEILNRAQANPSTIWSMAPRIEAYVDTAAFISFLDRSDSYHPLFRRLFSSPPSLITSALGISEGHGWFLWRYDTQTAVQFLHFVDEGPSL